MNKLSIFVNQEVVFEYDRDDILDEQKMSFLDKMDADMDRGIKIQGEMITGANTQQRARFVAMNLIKALQQENNAAIAVSCAYLSNRDPSLLEVHANDHDNTVAIEFVNDISE